MSQPKIISIFIGTLVLLSALTVHGFGNSDCLEARDFELFNHQAQRSDFYDFSLGEVAKVPRARDLDSHSIPRWGTNYVISLVFERGCEDTLEDQVRGHGNLPDLTCRYNSNDFLGCSAGNSTDVDPAFQEGSTVHFATSVMLSVELTSGVRVSSRLCQSSFISDKLECDSANDQELLVYNFLTSVKNRAYSDLIPHLNVRVGFNADNVAFGYFGAMPVIAYFMIDDHQLSGVYEVVNSRMTSLSSNGNLVMARTLDTLRSLYLPPEFAVFNISKSYEFRFDEYNKISSLKVTLDTALFYSKFPGAYTFNPVNVCTDIMNFCQGDVQMYASQQDCEAYYTALPAQLSPQPQVALVNDLACRVWHTALAKTHPLIHCLHISPYAAPLTIGGPQVTPCVTYDFSTGQSDPATPVPQALLDFLGLPNPNASAADPTFACESGPLCEYNVKDFFLAFLHEQLFTEKVWIERFLEAGVLIDQYNQSQ